MILTSITLTLLLSLVYIQALKANRAIKGLKDSISQLSDSIREPMDLRPYDRLAHILDPMNHE